MLFIIHCQFSIIDYFVVPRKRLELLHRKATASKTVVSTIPPPGQTKKQKRDGGPGRDRTYEGVSQRIYSPPHLTTLEPTHIWSHLSDLNWWPPVYKTGALPTELRWRVGELYKKCLSCQKIFLYWLHDYHYSCFWWLQTFLWSDKRIWKTYTKIRQDQTHKTNLTYKCRIYKSKRNS